MLTEAACNSKINLFKVSLFSIYTTMWEEGGEGEVNYFQRMFVSEFLQGITYVFKITLEVRAVFLLALGLKCLPIFCLPFQFFIAVAALIFPTSKYLF
jgi:hypothetical protein